MNDSKAYLLFAKGFSLKNVEILNALLTLVKSKDFPIDQVTQNLFKESNVRNSAESSGGSSVILSKINMCPPKSMELKLDELIRLIAENKPTDCLIDIYQSKLSVHQNTIDMLTEGRQHAEKEISELRHINSILRAQSAQSDTHMLDLIFKISNLEKSNTVLMSDLTSYKHIMADINNTLEQKKEKINKMSKNLQLKDSEIREYREKQAEMLRELDKKNHELTKIAEEHRQHLKKWEDICNQKQKKLNELEELSKSQTIKNNELCKEKQHLSNLVKEQELQIEKSEQKLQQYASEVEEGEEMRKIIMEVMNKKQKKK